MKETKTRRRRFFGFGCDRKPLKSRNQELQTRKVAKTSRFEAVWRRWDAAGSKEGKEQKPAFGPIGVVKIDFGLNLSHGSKFCSFFFEKKLLDL